MAYQETERHGKTESKRHSIFNGWELIAQQDGYQKQDLRRNRKQWTQTTGYAVCQPNGQPLALFNPQGKRTWRKAPNSLWGLPLLSSWERKQAEPLNPNLLFAGQYTDDESGLAYNRFRYYDPQSGNYLASDPIGLEGGETPYAYVHNPMGWVDPFGLAGCKPPKPNKGTLSQVQKNKKVGDRVRDEIALERGTDKVEQVFKTTGGVRRIDVLDGKIGIESKVGRTGLTKRTRQELARDIKLVRSGQLDGVEWVFTRSPTTGKIGPTAALESKLNKFGIPIIYR